MGAGQPVYDIGKVDAHQGLSIHTAILPQVEQTAVYNSINFSFGMADGTWLAFQVNQTSQKAQIGGFLCPSDPNATSSLLAGTGTANNCYYGSIGTTTDTGSGSNLSTFPYSGLFACQQSKPISAILDGTSNTMAFAEAIVGSTNQNQKQKLIGIVSVTLPAGALQFNAFTNPAAVKAAIVACTASWNSGSAKINKQRGDSWFHGSMAMTLFNTIVPPNGENVQWTYCSPSASAGPSSFSNADSYHPGGVNGLMADGRVQFFKNSINQATWWGLGTIAGGEIISSDAY
jgi:prepilin-type processing-associated H-X9-DG protein